MPESRGPNLRQALHRTARHHANNEALVDSQHRYTYRQMVERVRQTAALLYRLGVRKGDRVALMLLPSTIHPIALYGCWELGAVPVALHIREKLPVLVKTIERLSPRAMVYDGCLAERVAELRPLVPGITGYVRARSEATPADQIRAGDEPVIPDDLDRYPLDFEPMALAGHDLAAIVLTSGTTGIPKGVLHTHAKLVDSCRAAVYPFGLTPHSSTLNMFTTSFMGWYNLALPYFNIGARQIFQSQWDPKRVIQAIAEERVSHLLLVPTMWRLLLREETAGRDLSSLRQVGFAGEVMDLPTLEAIRQRITPHVINCYSTTETAVSGGTAMFPEDLARPDKIESVGKPLLNSEVRVVAVDGGPDDEMAPGEEGEILISGPSVAQEFWCDPPLSREKFVGPWWRSGDLGSFDADGYLYVRGRVDDMMISGGINVMPGPIENVLLGHPDVAEAAVVGLPDPEWGQRIVAFVVRKNAALSETALTTLIQDSDLPGYQRPREYRFLDELPRGNSGKTNRRALRQITIAG
ncbi:class I adenylate-forming enzyme family protein [Immundisolibacter sp.]|uniref:class I adenylate-forming enzyme family protein n=1 Tax=Immundisolibacter sp. TaxID=1934948 RepID=UPI00356275FE